MTITVTRTTRRVDVTRREIVVESPTRTTIRVDRVIDGETVTVQAPPARVLRVVREAASVLVQPPEQRVLRVDRQVTGLSGASAYDIAVANGFVGTQQQWIDSLGEPMPYATELDDTGTGVTYVGKADPGTLTSSASWQIQRITASGVDLSIDWADGDALFNNVWDDRVSLTYS